MRISSLRPSRGQSSASSLPRHGYSPPLITLAATLGALSLPVLAQTTPSTAVTRDQAVAIALAAQTGTIAEAELDQFEGRAAYDIEVVNAAGDEIEFKVDAETGEILKVWTDDDPTDDPVSADCD